MIDPTLVVLYLLATAASLLVLFFIIRAAVVGGLKRVEVWKAHGGVQAVLDRAEFDRTGIRPPSMSEDGRTAG